MTELVLIQEALRCPVCDEAGRVGFLERVMTNEEANFILGGKEIVYKCKTCGALFGVQE